MWYAREDSNFRPSPCKGAALAKLSYARLCGRPCGVRTHADMIDKTTALTAELRAGVCSDDRDRTYNTSVNSRVLCQLSYTGLLAPRGGFEPPRPDRQSGRLGHYLNRASARCIGPVRTDCRRSHALSIMRHMMLGSGTRPLPRLLS